MNRRIDYYVQKRIKDADISRVNEVTNRDNDSTTEGVAVNNGYIDMRKRISTALIMGNRFGNK